MNTLSRIFLPACLIAAVATHAQETSGIRFEHGLTWAQVQAKAKAENKYIFLDCFATWCGPCKMMDAQTYPDMSVGDFANAHFIAVRFQMDQTKGDSDEVKSWYPEVTPIHDAYSIHAFPTFLFFSPDGKAVHKAVGFKDPRGFLALLNDVLNPEKQGYTQLDNYRQGKCAYVTMPAVAKLAGDLGEQKLSERIARDYIDHYANRLADDQLLNLGIVQFMGPYLKSTDKLFILCLQHPEQVNEALKNKDLARTDVESVITREEINPRLYVGTGADRKAVTDNPEWAAITVAIAQKYDASHADRVVLWAKGAWFRFRKDYPNLAITVADQLDRYGHETKGFAGAYSLNDTICSVFVEHCSDPAVLLRAAKWQEKIVHDNPNQPPCIDTLANLLYKAGRTQEAIELETKAVQMQDAETAQGRRSESREAIRENLEKMKHGLPTWDSA